MSNAALDTLGEILIRAVRDESIDSVRMILSGTMKGSTAQEIREALGQLDSDEMDAVSSIVPGIVDQVMHNLLAAVEDSDRVDFLIRNGEEVRASEESDGLPGELYGARGWIKRFSRL